MCSINLFTQKKPYDGHCFLFVMANQRIPIIITSLLSVLTVYISSYSSMMLLISSAENQSNKNQCVF